jgi:hypothetical protein
MASPNDNITIKDGNANPFKQRTKDVSLTSDGSIQFVRHLNTPYPVDYGAGGCYQICSKSGIMAAGLAAAAPIYSWRWTNTTLLGILRRVKFQAWGLGTAFTAGIATIDMFVCRGWTAADTGGVTETITGDNNNLRTAMPAMQVQEIRHSSTAALTAGTRTKDVQPIESLNFTIGAVANQTWSPNPVNLYEKSETEHPLVLVQNEGFTVQATVPATGTWSWMMTTYWDEVPPTSY